VKIGALLTELENDVVRVDVAVQDRSGLQVLEGTSHSDKHREYLLKTYPSTHGRQGVSSGLWHREIGSGLGAEAEVTNPYEAWVVQPVQQLKLGAQPGGSPGETTGFRECLYDYCRG